MSAVPAGRVPLRIDFVSDVVCPWCAIGLAALEQALARLPDNVDVEFHVRPFELNPQMAPEGEDIAEHLQRKYGMSAEQLAAARANIAARGAEVGFTFGERQRIWNTFDAHRLLHWAGIAGRQLDLKRALLQAYHGDGENVSDHATLVRIAASVGLDAERAAAVLASGEYADEVRAEEQFFIRSGINSVPATIIDQQHLISGGQPVEVFERALGEIVAGKGGQDISGTA
ncbi:disulfide bond formation protein DsbA [Luteimonas chenhongjianii]|uniref:Disulfide bond formation protein DsbA n=1 Tax=Luteimonas chenhongjianii TaxID=2006110 RepID=A0A290XH44_9GAMM|nr:DsbA family oxidoreductase [Luteimonas chenhongjianii]ATD68256.1 disulfide bond formation protein DsbA [Luteimonas chenhongjianii]